VPPQAGKYNLSALDLDPFGLTMLFVLTVLKAFSAIADICRGGSTTAFMLRMWAFVALELVVLFFAVVP
jgi:hypothetical protein